MKLRLLYVMTASVFLTTMSAVAHHSFTATYIEDKTITIEGRVAQFLFRNPHSFIHVDVKGEDGKMVRWAVEGAAGQQFSQQGVGADSLRPGDHVVVTGSPGRNAADHRVRLKTIARPSDGWKWGGTVN
jgi:hypothetical protein